MSTERLSKRRRRNPSPALYGARNRYLDTLADDILRVVLRYLSNRPQTRNWHRYISAIAVNAALDVGGALARAASLEFRSIGGRDGNSLNTTYNASIWCPLVYRLPIHRLVLNVGGGQALPGVLRGCGAELRELELDHGWTVITETDILAISTCCAKLSSLAIRGYYFEGPLAPIWRSLGSTLTRIYTGRYYIPAFGYEIDDIISATDLVEHCVHLDHVDVNQLNDPIANVLIDLGSRIRVLNIENDLSSSIAQWREVCRACTSLEAVHLGLDISAEAIDALSLVRTKLVSLTLRNMHNLIAMEEQFFSVVSACSVLKRVTLSLRRLPLEALDKLFESLKSVTTLTCFIDPPDVNRIKDIIDSIACHLTNLESFTMFATSLKGKYLNALVDLPYLKSVCLSLSFSKRPERRAVNLMESLKDCAQLTQLELEIFDLNLKNRSPAIARAAATYKRKDFDMFIGGVQYRTW